MINLSDVKVEKKEFESLEGEYTLTVNSAEGKPSKSGRPMLAMVFGVDGTSVEKLHFNQVYDNEVGQQIVAGMIDLMGVNRNFQPADLVGKKVNAMLKKDGDYSKIHYFMEGATQEEVKKTDIPF